MATDPSKFSSGVRAGIGLIVVGGSVSLVSVTGIILYTAIKRLRGKHYGSDVSDSNLFLTLMVADLIYAFGVMCNLKWAVEGVITQGKVCTAQGILKQIGNNAVSFTSLAITIHTFLVLVMFWKPPKHTSRWAIAAICLCTALVVAIPNVVHRKDTYYADTGFWCFINSKYTAERLVTEYVYVWLTGIVMVILYPIMAVMMCGWARGGLNQATHAMIAKKLLLFPIIYNVSVLPNSVTRWLSFTNHDVSDEFILAANAIHAFSGFFNFVVFCITRPVMVFGIRRDIGLNRNTLSHASTINMRLTSPSDPDTRAHWHPTTPPNDIPNSSSQLGHHVVFDEVGRRRSGDD